MNKIKYIFSLFFLLYISSGPYAGTFVHSSQEQKVEALSVDGPYVLYQPGGKIRIINVGLNGKLSDTCIVKSSPNLTLQISNQSGLVTFPVKLKTLKRPNWNYSKAEKVFVMSDPHGNLECVISLLQNNGIIDKSYKWSFGKNHLVVIGDIFDRGEDVIPIFWLLYKLEEEAEKANGHLSFLIGNHESMVLANDLRYTKQKYKILADSLHLKYADLFGQQSELGRWIAMHNTIQIIDKDLFVHAGLSKSFYDSNINIPTANKEISEALFYNKNERMAKASTALLYGKEGPLWYRGLVLKKDSYHPLTDDSLQMILNRFHVNHIIVGHTIFKNVSAFHQNRVIGVNVDNQKNKRKHLGRALLIEKGKYIVVGDRGIMHELFAY